MRVATVRLPSNWGQFRSQVKKCLEFYTLLVVPPFQVNVRCGGKTGRIQVADCETLDDEQDWILKLAVSEFNLRIKNNPSKDPGKAAIEFREELDKHRKVHANNHRSYLHD